jgi:hypothetical protein
MEINHPDYGWIPFTASPNDSEQLGRDLYAEAIAGTLGVIADALPIIPNTSFKANNFAQSVKTSVGGILAANSLMIAYPAFFPAIQEGQWTDLQTLIIDANTKAVITPLQYAEIRQAATDNHIPITLP